MKLKKITTIFEKKFPKNIAEDWDNIGIMVGEVDSEIKKVQISLDITDEIVEKAIEQKADLIITHHPMIFKGIKSVTDENRNGKRIIKLIKNNIAVYSLHTNLDSAKDGLNQYIAEKLGMKDGKTADKKLEKIYKMRVFIPEEKVEEFCIKLKSIGVFKGDKYENAYYITDSMESYTPREGSAPYKGEIGKREFNKAKIIEFIVAESEKQLALDAVLKNHPYEEPAYEIIDTGRTVEIGGIGRIFDLEKSMKISDFIKLVKENLNIENIKVVFGKKDEVKRVAVVNGSGAEYIYRMKRFGVDLYVTSDIKYHEAQAGKESGMNLIDMGHFEGEVWFSDIIKKVLNEIEIENYVFNGEPVFKTF